MVFEFYLIKYRSRTFLHRTLRNALERTPSSLRASKIVRTARDTQSAGLTNTTSQKVDANTSTELKQPKTDITSTPPGADTLVGGVYVGTTPSDIDLECCSHEVTIAKTGLRPWARSVRTTGGQINISAELQQ